MRSSWTAGLASLGTYLAISLFNLHAIALYLGDQLTLYIHPRYVLFTVALNAFSLVACCAGFSATAWRVANGSYSGTASWRPSITLLMAITVLLAAYALPARTLSTETAEQRIGNFNSARAPSSATGGTLAAFRTGETPTLPEAATADLAIEDWVAAFEVEPTAGFYEGKEVDVVGFVFRPDDAPDDVFYVSRFVVTCCAVDAQPIGLPVRLPGWQERFEDDSWVRVTGRFTGADGVAAPVVIEPGRVELTEQPPNPYVN